MWFSGTVELFVRAFIKKDGKLAIDIAGVTFQINFIKEWTNLGDDYWKAEIERESTT